MHRSNRTVCGAIGAAAIIGGGLFCCSGAFAFDQYFDRSDKITRGAGNAVAHNMAVQTINPWPRNVGNDRINIDGKRIQLGMRRYQANRVVQPRGLGTSSLTFSPIAGAAGAAGQGGDTGGGGAGGAGGESAGAGAGGAPGQ